MTSEEENKNREDSEDEEAESDTASVASTKFSYYSINSTCSEKSRKQARLSNYAFCIQVFVWCFDSLKCDESEEADVVILDDSEVEGGSAEQEA